MYLRDIKFPYCSAEEMATLEKAVSNIYVDMQTNERISYAHRCYNTTRRRACALEQWFDNVISTIIQKDFKDAKKLEKETAKALRQERLRLMKEKLLEAGQNVEDLKEKADDFEDEEEPELMQLADCQITETDQDKQQTLSPGEENVPAPTPVPLRDLAPPPSQETIFGNIEQLKKQHEKESADFDKAQEMNKARMQQGLDEKLAARRNRRNRQSVME
ncbi:hypothetical protein FSP39_019713 [Pinctada imbricata]|uniref:Uncharacterized protein n=1 Tax=Pinctada imbricata TaxID=66713 RepID=A0AA88Y0Y2_PINIB|nr:hypothetical protein FSP39_019713 [Pinctada imbricata]